MKVRRSVLKDVVVVRTRTTEGSYGDVLAAPVTVGCYIDETRRLVRDANGQETVSEATLILHPSSLATAEDGAVMWVNPEALFSAESEVTIKDRVSHVITVKAPKVRNIVVAVEVTCA